MNIRASIANLIIKRGVAAAIRNRQSTDPVVTTSATDLKAEGGSAPG